MGHRVHEIGESQVRRGISPGHAGRLVDIDATCTHGGRDKWMQHTAVHTIVHTVHVGIDQAVQTNYFGRAGRQHRPSQDCLNCQHSQHSCQHSCQHRDTSSKHAFRTYCRIKVSLCESIPVNPSLAATPLSTLHSRTAPQLRSRELPGRRRALIGT